jgi:hypothetical protein
MTERKEADYGSTKRMEGTHQVQSGFDSREDV